MEKVKFGIIGMGNQGTAYWNMFERGAIENGVVSAICDIRQDRLTPYQDKGVAIFENYLDMLDSGVCDAILVEVPHYQHPEIVMACLERNIHTICEKPAGVYTKQVREMNEASKKSKARFGMMFNQRTNCVFRKMREIIASGGIGELQRVNWIITDWFRTQSYYDSGSWRATWDGEGGGVLINQCPHQIDLVQWVVGEMPVSVRGFCKYGKWHDIEVEDEVTAYFEYKNGATGVFITTTGETPGTNRFQVSGSKGQLVCENNELIWYKNDQDGLEFCKKHPGWGTPNVEKIVVETDGKNPQHAGIVNNFANAILGLEEQFVQGVDGMNGVELMNAMELSGWRNGAEITLPVNEEEYLAELTKRRLQTKEKKNLQERVSDTAGTYESKIK